GLSIADKYSILTGTMAGHLESVQASIERLAVSLASQFAPILELSMSVLTGTIDGLARFIEQNREIVATVAKVGVGLTALGGAYITAGVAAKALGATIGILSSGLTVLGVVVKATAAAWSVMTASISLATIASTAFAAVQAVV